MKLRTAAPTVVLILLAVFATAFAFINYSNRVIVWPLLTFQPLTLVIGVSLFLGAALGGLLVHMIHHKRDRVAVLGTTEAAPIAKASSR